MRKPPSKSRKNKSHLAVLRADAAPLLLLSPCGCASARGARENEVEAISAVETEREKEKNKEEGSAEQNFFVVCERATSLLSLSFLLFKHAALCFSSSDAVEDDGAVHVDGGGIEASPPRPSPRKSLCRGLKERRRRRRQEKREQVLRLISVWPIALSLAHWPTLVWDFDAL